MSMPPSPATVLLIDDDDLSRAVLELHLEDAGYAVISAESGDHAVALLTETSCSAAIILSDVQMPGLSGSALAIRLRQLASPSALLIAMSGSQPLPDRIQGFDTFLLKPLTPEQFTAAVDARRPSAASPQQSTTGSAEPVMSLDADTFSQLSGMLSLTQLEDLFTLAFTELQKQQQAMSDALDQGDYDHLRASAHAVKGSFGMLGARELQSLAARLEQADLTPADQAASLRGISPAVTRLQRMLSSRGVHLERNFSSASETQ